MKYIKKVAVSPIPEINGSVVDTFNVEDKTTNAPSVRAVEEVVFGEVMYPTYEAGVSDISSTQRTTYQKIGNRVFINLSVKLSQATSGTRQIMFYLPEEYRPKNTQYGIAVRGSYNNFHQLEVRADDGSVCVTPYASHESIMTVLGNINFLV